MYDFAVICTKSRTVVMVHRALHYAYDRAVQGCTQAGRMEYAPSRARTGLLSPQRRAGVRSGGLNTGHSCQNINMPLCTSPSKHPTRLDHASIHSVWPDQIHRMGSVLNKGRHYEGGFSFHISSNMRGTGRPQ
eukprot:3509867-Prymnesium_polylepis.1